VWTGRGFVSTITTVAMLLHTVGYVLRLHIITIILFKIYIYIMIQSPTSQI